MLYDTTECVTDLDEHSEMIIFRPIFEADGAVLKIGSSLKPNHHW